MKVFINPGHDPVSMKETIGYDCGAWNKRLLLYENEIAADISALVADYLSAAGCETFVFQSDSLSAIVDTSDGWGADVFVSIHCNAYNEKAHGTETHAYYNSERGKQLARCIDTQIASSLDITDRGVKTSDFYVIRFTTAPAVLVETAFIDNDSDAILLRDHKDAFARAITRGVTDYSQS